MTGGLSTLPRSSFLLGFFSVAAQVIILRECFVSYYGSELNLGTVLAAWLLWVGFGSLVTAAPAKRLAALPNLPGILAALQALTALLLPLSVLLMRTMPLWSPVPEGEFPSFAVTAATAALFTAGPGFASGAWFTVASLLPSPPRTGAGRVYAWEALGALAGGLGFTFFVAGRLEGMEAALVIAALTTAGAFLPPPAGGRKARLAAAAAVLAVAVAATALVFPRQGPSVAARSEGLRWPGLEIVAAAESPLGHLALVDLQGQKTLYTNGVPSLSFPGRRAEGAALHLTLLAAGEARSVLLVGGGPGGALGEILLHDIDSLHYVEADAASLPLIEPHLPPLLRDTLDEPRLRIIHDDVRHWLRSSSGTYDVVFIDMPEPSTALFNRFYTAEFFSLLKGRLSPGGLVAMGVTASPNYGSGDRGRRNRSIFGALRSVFGDVTVLAGEDAVFVARAGDRAPTVREFSEAAASSVLEAPSARRELLQTLLDPARAGAMHENLKQRSVINRDSRPTAYFYHAIYWGNLRDPALAPLLERITGPLRFAPLAIPLLLLAAAAAMAASGRRARRAWGPSLAALTTGWASMSLYGLVLFSYQASQGHLYHRIGMLTALFMAGSAAGGFTALRFLDGPVSPFGMLRRAETAFLLWAPVVGILLAAAGRAAFPEYAADVFFASLAAGTGFLTGLEFPLFTAAGGGSEGAGGRYYFLDLAGAAAGALLIFLWILPLLGLQAGILFAAALKLASLTAIPGRSA